MEGSAVSRINVDVEAFSDPRFGRLAALLGLADADHARSKVEHLWMACTLRGENALPQWLVEQHLGAQGPAALIESELARWAGGRGDSKTRRLYIRGSSKRTGWYKQNQEQSSKGGKARAAKASRAAGRFTSRVDGGATSPPAPAPAPVQERGSPGGLALLFDKVDQTGGDIGKKRNAKEAKRKAADNPDHQSAIDSFHQRFLATYGTKPTWDGKAIGMLSALLKRHKLETLVDRMDFMFAGMASWPPGPYSLDVFVKHIDRWVTDSQTPVVPLRRMEEL
jgi:hypothetical protein